MVSDDIEASALASTSSGCFTPLAHMCSVVQHSLQAALGAEKCNGTGLAKALKVSGYTFINCSFGFKPDLISNNQIGVIKMVIVGWGKSRFLLMAHSYSR